MACPGWHEKSVLSYDLPSPWLATSPLHSPDQCLGLVHSLLQFVPLSYYAVWSESEQVKMEGPANLSPLLFADLWLIEIVEANCTSGGKDRLDSCGTAGFPNVSQCSTMQGVTSICQRMQSPISFSSWCCCRSVKAVGRSLSYSRHKCNLSFLNSVCACAEVVGGEVYLLKPYSRQASCIIICHRRHVGSSHLLPALLLLWHQGNM